MEAEGRVKFQAMDKEDLIDIILSQNEAILKQNEEIRKLKEQLNRNSENSSKPPSSDGYKKRRKPQSERVKSEKKSGGQPDHEGSTLRLVENPDIIEKHDVLECDECKQDLSKVDAEITVRQEIDIPPIKPKVTEHHIASKVCPRCKKINKAGPETLTQSIQYGPRIKVLATYLHYEQLIPLQRTQGIFSDLFGLSISEGTLVNVHHEVSEQLRQPEIEIKTHLMKSAVINCDETGLVVNNQTQWLHSVSNSMATFYFVHKKRGTEAMDAMEILPNYTGIAQHDHWKCYFKYTSCKHALCNAHHVRELRGIFENYQQEWANKMRLLLYKINDIVNDCKKAGMTELPQEQITEFSNSYDDILATAKNEVPLATPTQNLKKRGRIKQHPSKNLLDRLTQFKQETLLFMYDFRVDFSNNQAERDIRMMKLRQKISGCFRSQQGAQRFCRIRGYISTARKQNINVLSALELAARGQPPNLFNVL